MKKLLIIAIALFTLNGMAQGERRGKDKQQKMRALLKDMSPTDIANLKSKKLTLALDLDAKQQKQVHTIILEEATQNQNIRKEREAKQTENSRPTKSEIIEFQSKRLDKKIELKRKMKTILTAEQYAKFDKINSRKDKMRTKRRNKRN
ncbi:hypothetical protein [uncultured Winogradskyella sp.]|uniref:hypothetical protein n=1 Tax=uncultured Winogradskyella sp. TaxID=395353 RepID=UPI0030D71F8E|tara:strand:- start:176226 stop:176669 length:444 start_codon:yes stop_codon:yes gene_type:complete